MASLGKHIARKVGPGLHRTPLALLPLVASLHCLSVTAEALRDTTTADAQAQGRSGATPPRGGPPKALYPCAWAVGVFAREGCAAAPLRLRARRGGFPQRCGHGAEAVQASHHREEA